MMPENFAFLYQEPVSAEEIEEECRRQQVLCKIPEEGGETEEPGAKPEKFQAVLVYGMEALDAQRIKTIFSGSDEKIDVNLLKWLAASAACVCFLGLLLSVFCCYEKQGCAKWVYGVTVLVWAFCIKCCIFEGLPEFPVWSLPGRWSDFEGWGAFAGEMGEQISCIIRFWDDTAVLRYYECIFKGGGCLLVSLAMLKAELRKIMEEKR
ncbi:MAG: hypothetical protein HFH49_00055 [Lachnospiraceae bacterium]|nr:hypothetical protein [Lachnospiraceae bacterium]